MREEVRLWARYEELTEVQQTQAFEVWAADRQGLEIPWLDETHDSLKGLLDALGVQAMWDIGPFQHSSLKLRGDHNWFSLTGARALGWWENNVLSPHRVPWTGKERWKMSKYGQRAGEIISCPFTGYFLDDLLLRKVQEALVDGDSLRQAVEGLASVVASVLEEEYEYSVSRDAYLEQADWYEYRIEDGRVCEILPA